MEIIQTKYKGYYFRSRLEARWAVFFDSLDIEWEYEKEGYHFEDGTNYLPDFWLPQVNRWAEVKGTEFTLEEIKKVKNLVNDTKIPCILLVGVPKLKAYEVCEKEGIYDEVVLSNYHCYPKEEGRFYSMPAPEELNENCGFGDTIQASNAAKSARFEFGDKK